MKPAMIRLLEAEDAPAVLALRHAGLVDSPMSFGAAPETDQFQSEDAVRAYLSGAPENVLCGAFDLQGETEGALVGLIGMVRGRHSKVQHRAMVWGMYVAPDARKQGLGRALIEATADHAAELGADFLDLAVSEVSTAAHKLYERAGLFEYGRHPAGIRHQECRTVEILMTRKL